MKCGCGKDWTHMLYDEKPHCQECYEDAIDSTVPVLVQTRDGWERMKSEQFKREIA